MSPNLISISSTLPCRQAVRALDTQGSRPSGSKGSTVRYLLCALWFTHIACIIHELRSLLSSSGRIEARYLDSPSEQILRNDMVPQTTRAGLREKDIMFVYLDPQKHSFVALLTRRIRQDMLLRSAPNPQGPCNSEVYIWALKGFLYLYFWVY